MINVGDHLARAVRALEKDTLTIGEAEYACVASTLETGTVLEINGRVEQINLGAVVRTMLLPSIPSDGSRVKVNGTNYRVISVRNSPGHVRLLLGSVNR